MKVKLATQNTQNPGLIDVDFANISEENLKSLTGLTNEQFTDLENCLKSLRSTSSRYLAIMPFSFKVVKYCLIAKLFIQTHQIAHIFFSLQI